MSQPSEVESGPAGRAPSSQDRRIRRLRDELADEAVPLSLSGPRGHVLLEELTYAQRPAVHERHVPRYGSIIFPDDDALPRDDVSVVPLDTGDVSSARRFADGRAAFLVRARRGSMRLLCFHQVTEDESILVELQRTLHGQIVQRTGRGLVRVFDSATTVTWDGVRWISKPPAFHFEESIRQRFPQADPDILAGLLQLCVHWLSSAFVGSTLVWYLTEPGPDLAPYVDLSAGPPVPPLDLRDRAHFPALLSVLRQVDGAAIVGPDGRLRHLRAMLRPSTEALRRVGVFGGARHTSAQRFSFDRPDCVAFVVSEDGPVSVFAGGHRTALVETDHSWTTPPSTSGTAGD